MSLVWKPMFPSQSDKLHNNGGEVSEKVTLSDEELYEAVKRFCRTEKASHNLMELIKAYGDKKVSEALSTIHGIANDLATEDGVLGSGSITPYFGNATIIYQEYLKGDNYERIDVRALKLPTLERLRPQSPEKRAEI